MGIINKKMYIISLSLLVLLIFTCLGAVSAENSQTNNNINNVLTVSDSIQNDNGSDINVLSESEQIEPNVLLSSNNNVNLESSSTVNILGDSNSDIYVNSSYMGDDSTGSQLKPFKNISAAVNHTNTTEGSDFTINIAPGEYNITSTMTIIKNVTFQRIGDGEVIINGKDMQIFTTPNDDGVYNIVFNNLTLTNASTTGNGSVINIQNKSKLEFNYCVIKGNNATNGGAVFLVTGNVTVNNSTFMNNTAKNNGGAICIGYYENRIVYGSGNVFIMNGSSFTGNKATIVGGSTCKGGCVWSIEGNVTVINSTLNNNYADYGGVINMLNGTASIVNSTLNNNYASYYSGVIDSEGNVTVINSTLNYNSNGEYGAASAISADNISIFNSILNNNTEASLGVLYANTNVNINSSTLNNNKATKGLCGVVFAGQNITIFNSTLNNNKASGGHGYGGVIYKWPGTKGNVNLTYSVLINNTAGSNGSVIYAPNITDISNNWWGNNTPFSKDDNLIFNVTGGSQYEPIGGFISPSNHLILSFNVDPTSVNTGETSKVSVEFHNNLTGDLVSVPSRVLSLSSNGGSFNPSSTNITSTVTSVFTAGNTAGGYTISATVDNETLTKNITVINSVPPISPIETVLIGEDITTNQTSVDFTVTLKTVNDTVLPDESVLYILYNGDYHPVTTDTNGVATITLNNLTLGTYSIRYVYFGNSLYASCNGSSTVTVTNTSKADSKMEINYTDNVLSFNLTSNGAPLGGQNFNVTVNGVNYTLTTDNDGLAYINCSNCTGDIIITYNYAGNSTVNGVKGALNISDSKPSMVVTDLSLNNLTMTYGEGLNLTGKLLNLNGDPISGMHINLNLTRLSDGASKIYQVTTDTLGEYQLEINLYSGEYTATATFNGETVDNITYMSSGPVNGSILVNKTGTVLTADKFNETYNAGRNFTGKLVDHNGKPISGQHIALNLTNPSNGLSKIYYATTDTIGEYQLAINLYSGEYTAQCSYAGTSQYEASNTSTSISVTV